MSESRSARSKFRAWYGAARAAAKAFAPQAPARFDFASTGIVYRVNHILDNGLQRHAVAFDSVATARRDVFESFAEIAAARSRGRLGKAWTRLTLATARNNRQWAEKNAAAPRW